MFGCGGGGPGQAGGSQPYGAGGNGYQGVVVLALDRSYQVTATGCTIQNVRQLQYCAFTQAGTFSFQ